jgi:hypothetical protein
MDASPLAGWDNFYVIVGSAAAGLTGLTFVVIALIRDARNVRPTGLRAFVTPTIVHFGGVLGAARADSVRRGCDLARPAVHRYPQRLGHCHMDDDPAKAITRTVPPRYTGKESRT